MDEPKFTIKDDRQEITGITLNTSNRRREGVLIMKKEDKDALASLGGTPESSKLKVEMLSKKPKNVKEKLPAYIRKAYITINDKKKNEPISVSFSGEWSGSDINLAGKHLILEYGVYVRNRAIRSK